MTHMTNLAVIPDEESIRDIVAKTIIDGDLSRLPPRERVLYYMAVCQSLGLNHLSKPFELIRMDGKVVLYAKKDCTDQLRKIHNISLDKPETHIAADDIFVVTITARTPDGRTDTDMGATSIKGLNSNNLCNAMMKSLTKAKRRVTLAICGLGALDESELDTIPHAKLMRTYFDDDQAWRRWRTPEDAILWAEQMLPEMTMDDLQAEFDALEPHNGKKAIAWIARVNELLQPDNDRLR